MPRKYWIVRNSRVVPRIYMVHPGEAYIRRETRAALSRLPQPRRGVLCKPRPTAWVIEFPKTYALKGRATACVRSATRPTQSPPTAGDGRLQLEAEKAWKRVPIDGTRDLIGDAALPAENPGTELFVSEREREECRDWLRSMGIDSAAPLVCIQAGSKRTTRRGSANRASTANTGMSATGANSSTA